MPAADRGEIFAVKVGDRLYDPQAFLGMDRASAAAVFLALGDLGASEKLMSIPWCFTVSNRAAHCHCPVGRLLAGAHLICAGEAQVSGPVAGLLPAVYGPHPLLECIE